MTQAMEISRDIVSRCRGKDSPIINIIIQDHNQGTYLRRELTGLTLAEAEREKKRLEKYIA
jgi:hypothetical protein